MRRPIGTKLVIYVALPSLEPSARLNNQKLDTTSRYLETHKRQVNWVYDCTISLRMASSNQNQ